MSKPTIKLPPVISPSAPRRREDYRQKCQAYAVGDDHELVRIDGGAGCPGETKAVNARERGWPARWNFRKVPLFPLTYGMMFPSALA